MRRGMEHVGPLLGGVLRDCGLAKGVARWRPVVEWRALVGDEIADHAEAFRFQRGVLWVGVANSVWAQHITYLKPRILQILQRDCPDAQVTDIHCVIRGGRAGLRTGGE